MRKRCVPRIAIAALLLAAAGDLGFATPARATEPGYSVTIEPGLTPRMQASEVVELLPAEQRTKVLSLECMSNQTYVVVPDDKKIWLVRVKVGFFRPRWNASPIASDTTSYLIDDATGTILGRGTF